MLMGGGFFLEGAVRSEADWYLHVMLWPVHLVFRAELDEANKETDEEYKRYLDEMTEEMLNKSASTPLPFGSIFFLTSAVALGAAN